ncbi:hypothetical protein [Corynebacterium lipophiloflavum]|nr:hypothetical protein [Corynebacterium lipophiloflavum]
MKRTFTATLATFASAALVACGTPAENSTVTVTATPEQTTEVVSSPASATQAEVGGNQAAEQQAAQLPASVSGYTDEARQELADEGVTEAEVERVLQAANNNEAGVEVDYDDDGYYEIKFQGIEIDILPDGTVTDVER